MNRALALAAWACALACLAGAPRVFDDVPRTTLALLPFLALAGVPAGEDARTWRALALAAPLLGIAAALDLRQLDGLRAPTAEGLLGALVHDALQGLVLLALLAAAARRARHPAYGPLWFGGVIVLPLFAAVVAWDGAPGGGVAWLSAAARISPLDWILRAPGTLAPAPLVFCGLLLALGSRRGGAA